MSELDRQVEYWDQVANAKTFSHPLDLPLLERHLRFPSRVLDYGCGYGRLAEEMRKKGHSVVGRDISVQMIERGRRLYPSLDLQVAQRLPVPFDDASFDLVILFAVLTCIPSDEGQREVIREIGRVLIPAGFLYVSDYLLQDDQRNRLRYRSFKDKFGKFGVFELPEGAVVRHHERAWLESLFRDFEELAYKEIPVTTMNGSAAKGFQFLGKKRDVQPAHAGAG